MIIKSLPFVVLISLSSFSFAFECSVGSCLPINQNNTYGAKKFISEIFSKPNNGSKLVFCEADPATLQCLNNDISVSSRWTIPPFLPTRIDLSALSISSKGNQQSTSIDASYTSIKKPCVSSSVEPKITDGKVVMHNSGKCIWPVIGEVEITNAFELVGFSPSTNTLFANFSIDVSGGLSGNSAGFALLRLENFDTLKNITAFERNSVPIENIQKKPEPTQTVLGEANANLVTELEKYKKINESSAQRQKQLEEQLKVANESLVKNSKPKVEMPVVQAHALVIGNSNYQGGNKLENPVNDAHAITLKLRELGFTVDEVVNANRGNLVSALSKFERTSRDSDISLLFYAGHGVQVAGVNYMLPIDIDMSDLSQAPLHGVSLSSVVEQYLPGKTKLVFLDACRDNPLMQTKGRGVSRGLAPINVSEGTLISYATKDGQIALDGTGRNSPFTSALIDHLGDPDDIAVVLRKVREKVMKTTGGKQQPWEYGSLTGGALVLSAIKPTK